MTQADYEPFQAEFTRLMHALDPYKKTPETIRAKGDAYFHALKGLDLRTVCAKADAWLEKEAKFPKPAEWKAQLVPKPAIELRVLTQLEAETYRKAEQIGFENDPCHCGSCIQAGVTEKPIRFVPEFDRHDVSVKVIDPIGNRTVVAGHWAHGAELARWYEARGSFWNRAMEFGLLSKVERKNVEREPILARLERIYAKVRS